MAKLTDIRASAAELFFLPVETRVPLKFGPETPHARYLRPRAPHRPTGQRRHRHRLGRDTTQRPVGLAKRPTLRAAPSSSEGFLHPPDQSLGGIRRPRPFTGTGPRLPAKRTAQAARRIQRQKPRRRTDTVARCSRMLLGLRHRAARRAWPITWQADLRNLLRRVSQPRPWPVPRAGQRLRHQLRRSVP